MLGRRALGSFKEDKVMDFCLQQITHKLFAGLMEKLLLNFLQRIDLTVRRISQPN